MMRDGPMVDRPAWLAQMSVDGTAKELVCDAYVIPLHLDEASVQERVDGARCLIEAEARQLLSQARGLIGGKLRVGADSPYHVLPVMAAFGRRYPTIERAISFGNSEEVLDALLEQRGLVEGAGDRFLQTLGQGRIHGVATGNAGTEGTLVGAREAVCRKAAGPGGPLLLRGTGRRGSDPAS